MNVKSNPYEASTLGPNTKPGQKPPLAVSIVAGIGGTILGLVLLVRIATSPKIDFEAVCIIVGSFVGLFSCGLINRYPRIHAVLATILGIIATLVAFGLLTHIRMTYWR